MTIESKGVSGFTQRELFDSMLLYAVTDNAWLNGRTLEECVRAALCGGATFIQLRDKSASTEELVSEGAALKAACADAGVPFVVDDDIEAALALGADGVHVGQSDESCAYARKKLGPDAIVGVSTQTVQQALEAEAAGASYLGVGAVFGTPTKPEAFEVPLDELRAICEAVSIPVVAIGGLNAKTVPALKGSGARGAAVVSAVFAAKDITEETAALKRVCEATFVRSALTIAGSDSSGGAGIQADIKTMMANGVYAQSALTALTAQNTTGVQGVEGVAPEFVTAQIESVYSDIRPDAVKIGMLPSAAVVRAVAGALVAAGARHVVLDPVMVATSGSSLASSESVQAMAECLIPLAEVVTPNIPEAEVLSGMSIATKDDMVAAGRAMCEKGCHAALVKGGHSVEDANDVLVCASGEVTWFNGVRIQTENTHGTGCTLSSAIAANLAKGLPLVAAIEEAKRYITGALEHDLHLGKGSGPLNHAWNWVK